MILIPCWISTIWRGREVSRPYHAKSFWEIGRFDSAFFQEIILSFRGFSPWNGERFLSLVQCGEPSWEGGGGIVWLVAWKLVSNDAKRTVAPPNAKHSTPCSKAVFYVFVFDYIHDSATMHNLYPGFFHWSDSIGVKKSTQKKSCEICVNLWLIFNHEFHKSHE